MKARLNLRAQADAAEKIEKDTQLSAKEIRKRFREEIEKRYTLPA